MLKKAISVLVLSVILVLTSACGNKGMQAVNTETPVNTPSESPIAETPEPAMFNKDFIVPRPTVRPVAVMIDNQGDRVLPQGGIQQAQIVYEMLAEYNITRFMCLFWDTMPEMIGPVRSSRHYFLDYSMEHDAVYTHFGWSDYAKADISKLKIQNINGLVNGNAFWDLTKDKGNWQDSYTSKDRIEKEISALKYRTEPKKQFPFTYFEELTIPASDKKAEDIFIKFVSSSSNCGFTYNPESGLYARTRMKESHVDRNTGEQVQAANIIILEIASPLIEGDAYGRRNLKNIGEGKGFFITGGKAVPIKWAKKARDAQTAYTTEEGKPITLNRGQTWIEIVPKLADVEIK
ncbi:MAG TPA: DUF3048 domain-containing protein [Ruminiclostridium sp.]|nr:DUF3048 domain-containing protein [Ruminiclostridium sp.]